MITMRATRLTLEQVSTYPWWPIALGLILSGRNVTVQDPAATAVYEYWDDDPAHGTVQIVRRGRLGWVVSTYELDPEDDEATIPPDLTEESDPGPPPVAA